MTTCLVVVSIGELWDKYTILRLKNDKIADVDKLEYVKREIDLLRPHLENHPVPPDVEDSLYITNGKLWDIEDALRRKEASKVFDEEFIQLARSVYRTNDERCAIKNRINETHDSLVKEVKSYAPY